MRAYHYVPVVAILAVTILTATAAVAVETPPVPGCRATAEDALGPFYKPDAPYREAVGRGYVVEGTVRSARDCAAVSGAVVEFWLAGPDGDYGDDWRARVKSGTDGSFRFESDMPPPYWQRPPHIHIRVTAPGYRTLVTQHYPKKGNTEALFDLVIIPESR